MISFYFYYYIVWSMLVVVFFVIKYLDTWVVKVLMPCCSFYIPYRFCIHHIFSCRMFQALILSVC